MSNELRLLNEVSLADRAEEMIRSAILNGELKPNQRFTIEDIAAQLGISRTPVREALKALQVDGLVRLLPHRGAMVEAYAHDEIRNRYYIKAMLEGYAAELAVASGAEGLAARLSENCDRLEQLSRGEPKSEEQVLALTKLNAEFHQMIHEASGSKTLIRLLTSLRHPTQYTKGYWRNDEASQASLTIHRQIAEAFRQGDAVLARALVQKHLTDAYDRVMRHFVEAEETESPPLDRRSTGT